MDLTWWLLAGTQGEGAALFKEADKWTIGQNLSLTSPYVVEALCCTTPDQ